MININFLDRYEPKSRGGVKARAGCGIATIAPTDEDPWRLAGIRG
jgi:hypothetical protein